MKKIILTILLAMSAAGASSQERRMAVIEFSTSYLRLEPDYESPLETQELMGTVVEITGEHGYWMEIISPQPYKAWCTDQGLIEMSREQTEAYEAAPKVMSSTDTFTANLHISQPPYATLWEETYFVWQEMTAPRR